MYSIWFFPWPEVVPDGRLAAGPGRARVDSDAKNPCINIYTYVTYCIYINTHFVIERT